MVTRAEATQHGNRFAEKWDAQKHIAPEEIKNFQEELSSLDKLPAPQKNALKWAELRGATDGLIDKKILPKMEVADDKSGLRNCRVVGFTADGDKNPANDDLVVAIGRKKGQPDKAQDVVILGQDGKFYRAQEAKGGYVRSNELVAQNADELEKKYGHMDLKPKSQAEDKKPGSTAPEKTPNREQRTGNPADLDSFRKDMRDFQKYSPISEQLAKQELNKLAEEYSHLSKEQQNSMVQEIIEANRQVRDEQYSASPFARRPQLSVQRGPDGTIRFSADWQDGYSWKPWPFNDGAQAHTAVSNKYKVDAP